MGGFGALRGLDKTDTISGGIDGGIDCHGFSDNFNREVIGTDWISSFPDAGVVDIVDNKLRMFGVTGNVMTLTRLVQFKSKPTKTTVSVRITLPDRNNADGFRDRAGLFIMGESQVFEITNPNAYLFYLDNYTNAMGSEIYGHLKVKLPPSALVTQYSVSSWDVGSEAELRVEITGSSFEVFIDELLVTSFIDSSRVVGMIGLVAQPATEGVTLFDDFIITC